MIIKECLSPNEIKSTFSVMKQLREKLADEAQYLALIQSLKQTEGYRLIALFDEEKCVAAAGFRIKRCLFGNGLLELYVDDFVTDASQRSKGRGKKLFAWLENEAIKLDCAALILDSGTQRLAAHKFYEREGMSVTSLHFYKSAKQFFCA